MCQGPFSSAPNPFPARKKRRKKTDLCRFKFRPLNFRPSRVKMSFRFRFSHKDETWKNRLFFSFPNLDENLFFFREGNSIRHSCGTKSEFKEHFLAFPPLPPLLGHSGVANRVWIFLRVNKACTLAVGESLSLPPPHTQFCDVFWCKKRPNFQN